MAGPHRGGARRHASATTTASEATREIVIHPGRSTVAVRRRADLARAPAARAGGGAVAARAAGREARRGGRGPSGHRAARACRGDRDGGARVAPPRELLQLARPALDEENHLYLARICSRSAATPRRRSGSRSCRCRSRELDETIAGMPRREDADRPACGSARSCDGH